jgi:ubiquinone/menaquinone biosynthesis C-methylase UbiE
MDTQAQRSLFDPFVQQYTHAKTEVLKSGPDPAYQFVSKHLTSPAEKTLLDAGCGTGDEAADYERMGFRRVYGIDPSRKMLERAAAKVACPENFYRATFEHTGFPHQSFDVVVGNYSFHYVEDLCKAYREIARILRPEGLLLLSVRHPFSDLREPDRFFKNRREYVRALVYGRVSIEHPIHSIGELFSPTFLSLFDLIDVQEWEDPIEHKTSPFLLGYAARRRAAPMSRPSKLVRK